MSKSGVRVVVRTRPTAAFAQDRIFINVEKNVSILYFNFVISQYLLINLIQMLKKMQ